MATNFNQVLGTNLKNIAPLKAEVGSGKTKTPWWNNVFDKKKLRKNENEKLFSVQLIFINQTTETWHDWDRNITENKNNSVSVFNYS